MSEELEIEREIVWDSCRTDSPVRYETTQEEREFNSPALMIYIERYSAL
jgi:hypothetical protein